jgi:hypothetical protein
MMSLWRWAGLLMGGLGVAMMLIVVSDFVGVLYIDYGLLHITDSVFLTIGFVVGVSGFFLYSASGSEDIPLP